MTMHRLHTPYGRAACGILLLSLPILVGASPRCEVPPDVYVFSSDARYVRLSGLDLRLTDVGNLWWLGVDRVDFTVPGEALGRVIISTEASEDDSRPAGTSRLMVLSPVAGRLVGAAGDPPVYGTASSTRVIRKGGESLLAIGAGGKRAAALYDEGLGSRGEIEGLSLSSRSCEIPRQHVVLSLGYGPLALGRWDTRTDRVQVVSLEHVGDPAAARRVVVAIGKGCEAVVVEVPEASSPKRKLYVADVPTGEVRGPIETDVEGDFLHLSYLSAHDAIVVGEVELVQVFPEQGEDSPLRATPTGRLFRFDVADGAVRELELPAGGEPRAFACDDRWAYYYAPGRLVLVDVASWTAVAEVELPFEWASLALLGE